MTAQPRESSRPVADWLRLCHERHGPLHRALTAIYGDEPEELARKVALCRLALETFRSAYGRDARPFIVHSAGRVNLLGMHIDHRGGFTNPIAVKEMFLVAEPREDDRVVLRNVESDRYPDAEFSIREELPEGGVGNWDAWTQALAAERARAGRAGHWSDYVKAAVLYLQHLHTGPGGEFEPPLRGMNVAVHGDIHPAAGLSSSSGLVVAAAEACAHINALTMTPMELVDACAMAEWYVGTRGGGGDQAAIKFGRLDHIMHIGSFPTCVDWIPFPSRYRIVLANSLKKAEKSAGARDLFNQRVACYVFGLLLLRCNFPEYADRMEHLRDVNPETLSVSEADIYRMLASLPVRATRE